MRRNPNVIILQESSFQRFLTFSDHHLCLAFVWTAMLAHVLIPHVGQFLTRGRSVIESVKKECSVRGGHSLLAWWSSLLA